MARTPKPKAAAPEDLPPQAGAGAAGEANSPVTPPEPPASGEEAEAIATPPIPDASAEPTAGEPAVVPGAGGFTLRVRALQPVRWRIGRQFTAEPTELVLTDLQPGAFDALVSDPMLAVDVI